ncbi:MAG: hypothetical protein ACRDBG_13810 [Waterburya sp.]
MKSLGNNKQSILKANKSAFTKMVNQVGEAIQQTMTEPMHWDGFERSITNRKNGELVVGATRNIVDLGNASGSQSTTISGNSATISWDGNGETPMQDVYFGAVNDNGKFIPGRPFVHRTLASVNIGEMYISNYNHA